MPSGSKTKASTPRKRALEAAATADAAGSWLTPESEVEVIMDEDGLRGSKYPARIVMVRAGKAFVEHYAFHSEEGDDAEKLREWCDCSLVTPRPPPTPADFAARLFVGQPAELLWEDGWWRVTIVGTPEPQQTDTLFEVHAENYNLPSRFVPPSLLRPRWEMELDADNLQPLWQYDSKPPKLPRRAPPADAASDAASSTGDATSSTITNEDGLVTHAAGFALHLMSASPTGYVGVHARGTRFLAKSWDDGTFKQIGCFDSAVEAAIAYAAHQAARDEAEQEQVEKHAEGWKLILSSTSSTGYEGVERKHAKQHRDAPYCAKLGGRLLGYHVTALSAAIDYAKAVAEDDAEAGHSRGRGLSLLSPKCKQGAEKGGASKSRTPVVRSEAGDGAGSETACDDDDDDDESDERSADARNTTPQKRFIPRPRGRGPVGKEWDTSIGGWVPMGMSNGEAWVSTRLPDGKRYRPDRRRELGKDKRARTAARQEGGGKRGNTSQPLGGLCGGGSRGYSSNSDGDGIGQRRMLSLQPVRAKATVLPSGRVELRLERHKDHPASAAVESGEPMEEEEDGAQTPPLHLRPRSMQIDADGGPAVKDEEADAQEADSSDDDCDAEAAHERHVANWQRLAAARAAARAATNASGASSAKRGPEAPLVSSRPASKEAMCGTFGCILLNNHRGLHQLPPDAADRPRGVRSKRMEPLPGETEAELLPGGLFARGRRKEVAEPFELCQPAAPTSPAESSGGVVKADKDDGEPKAEADGEDIVTEAEGYQLHLSVGSSTGYAGVYRKGGAGAGAVEVRFQGHYLGRFETPLQGAIAYAKYHLTEGKGETQVEKKPGKKAPGKKAEAASKGPETLPLVEKVKLIQRELGIAESTLIKQTLDDANETLGIAPPAGQSIKEQVEVVLQQIAY